MTDDQRIKLIFDFMLNRKIAEFEVHEKTRKLAMRCTDGAVMFFWADDEGYLCFDIDRETRQ